MATQWLDTEERQRPEAAHRVEWAFDRLERSALALRNLANIALGAGAPAVEVTGELEDVLAAAERSQCALAALAPARPTR